MRHARAHAAPAFGPEWVGHYVLGPVLAAFADHACARLDRTPGLHALALGRDGTVLGEAARRRSPALARRVADAWFGRRLTAIAAIADAHDREALANLLIRMRHRPATAAAASAELGLLPPTEDADVPLSGEAFERFCDRLAKPAQAARVKDRVQETRRQVLAHLDSLPLPDNAPLLLLDVGYAGTIQRCLSRALKLAGRPRPVHGLYLFTSPGIVWAMAEGGEAHGVLGALGAPEPFATIFLRHRDVVECLLSTPEGELAGYGDDGRPHPLPSVLPAGQRLAAARLHATALAFVEHWRTLPSPAPEDTAAVARLMLARLFVRPLRHEVALMGDWVHADATALDGLRRLADGPPQGGREHTLWPAAAALRSDPALVG